MSRVRAYKYLSILCTTLPVHIVYGMINDYLCVRRLRPSLYYSGHLFID